jgi:hypothetical protein
VRAIVHRHALGVEPRRRRLAHRVALEADHARRARRAREHRRLDQALEVERHVVAAAAQLADEPRHLAPPPPRVDRHPLVETAHELEDARVPHVHEPVDPRGRPRPPTRREHRQRVHDVAEGAEPDDEDAQGNQATRRGLTTAGTGPASRNRPKQQPKPQPRTIPHSAFWRLAFGVLHSAFCICIEMRSYRLILAIRSLVE